MKYLLQIWLFVGLITYQLVAQVNYTSKEGNFNCSFPEEPTEGVSELEDGTKVYHLQSMKGEEIYMIFFANYANKADKTIAKVTTEATKDAFVEKLQAEVKSEKTYDYKGYTGYELKLITSDDFIVYYRVIYINQTIYQFAVVGANPKVAEVNNFFSSFKYTGK